MEYIVNDIPRFLADAESEDKLWGFDLETWQPTTDPDPWHPEGLILTAALARKDRVYGFVLDHPLDLTTTDEDYASRMEAIDSVLSNPSATVVCHNLTTFDAIWWMVHMSRSEFGAQQFDTRIAHSLVDENYENSLDALARKYDVGVTKNIEGLNAKRLNTYEPERVLLYNMDDAVISRRLYEPVMRDIADESQDVMLAFMRRVALETQAMTMTGIKVDVEWIKEKSTEIRATADEQRTLLESMLGGINVTSSVQLADVLYNKMGIPAIAKTAKGKPATSVDAFLALKNKTRISKGTRYLLDEILSFRTNDKLEKTYLRPVLNTHMKSDGRIHPTYNIGKGREFGKSTGAGTGRLSSSKPNAQNMPRDPRLRGMIVPSDGMRLFDGDYSQLELRLLAWYSQDPIMLKAFENDEDLHVVTMSRIAGISYEEGVAALEGKDAAIWKDKRTRSKRTNFGIPYGIGPYSLMKQMWSSGVSATEASSSEDIQYWKRTYREANNTLEGWKDEVVSTGRLITPTGRIRRLPGGSRFSGAGNRVLRQGVNFPIQSLAADVTFVALYLLAKKFRQRGDARLLLTVHDSIMGEYGSSADEEEIKNLIEIVMTKETESFMEKLWGITGLNLKADVKVGLERWS